MSRSSSADQCYPIYFHNDGVCRENPLNTASSENPVNSPKDCPDQFSRTDARQLAWYGDGRCTGVETWDSGSPFYSIDCKCGNGSCDNGEHRLSCLEDCYFCGDRTCNSGETVQSCPQDCACGNNVCESSLGENLTTCSVDCKCGDGTCQSSSPYNETWVNCLADCHCGNGVCNVSLGESRSTCAADCTANDGICDADEVLAPLSSQTYYALNDCHCGIDVGGNGYGDYPRCDTESPYFENASNCPFDCSGGNNYPLLPLD